MVKLPSHLIDVSHLPQLLFTITVVSTLLLLLSFVMLVRGIVKKSGKHLAIWAAALVVFAIVTVLSVSGQFIRVV